MVPSAMNTGAYTHAIGSVRVSEVYSVDVLYVRRVRACENSLRVFEHLVAWAFYLDLLVQAQVLEAREDAHVVGGELSDVKSGSRTVLVIWECAMYGWLLYLRGGKVPRAKRLGRTTLTFTCFHVIFDRYEMTGSCASLWNARDFGMANEWYIKRSEL